MAEQSRLDKVIALARHRGFVFQAGEIYGGSRSAWDYGPLGTELKENIRRQWWQTFVRGRGDMVGLDSSIILPKRVWEASGHVATFSDPLVECLQCHKRFRADNLIEDFEARKGRPAENGLADVPCPNCGTKGQYTEPKAFSGLVKTYLGVVDDESGLYFLRPETAQGIAEKIDAGSVTINDGYASTWASISTPLGGVKESGVGRRHGHEGLTKYTEAKNISSQRIMPMRGPSWLPNKYYGTLLSSALRLGKALRFLP